MKEELGMGLFTAWKWGGRKACLGCMKARGRRQRYREGEWHGEEWQQHSSLSAVAGEARARGDQIQRARAGQLMP